MSRKGNCGDNAVAESFFGSLKKERIKKQIHKSRALAQADVAAYINTFYNRTRRHSYLGGLSPEQFEAAHKPHRQGLHLILGTPLENIDPLATTGVYSRLRHPMYAGFVLWIGGWVVAYGAVVSVCVGLAGIGNILYWRHLEEGALESPFGEDYRVYRRATWF